MFVLDFAASVYTARARVDPFLRARTSHLPHGNGKTPQKERRVFPAPRAGLQPRLSILRRAAAARRRAR